MKQALTAEPNELGQPVGQVVEDWSARPLPNRQMMSGRFCRVEPLDPSRHAQDLFEGHQLDSEGANWTYLPAGPFGDLASFSGWLQDAAASTDPEHYAFVDLKTDKPVGTGSYLRMDPANGVIEVGYLTYTPLMQRTSVSTEAMYLMMRRVFDDLGYRRYEWKCNALNEPSCAAARRLGFTYEGTFRQAVVTKGRNRDTAWFSITDNEWPEIRQAFEAWLAPDNFDAAGQQLRSLSQFRK